MYSKGEHKAGPDPTLLHKFFKWEEKFQGEFWIITITIKKHLSAFWSAGGVEGRGQNYSSALQVRFKESLKHNLFSLENC